MFYNKYITNLILKLGEQSTKILDKGSIELIGPYGAQRGLTKLSKEIEKITEDTNIPNYALIIAVGLLFLLGINVLTYSGLNSNDCLEIFMLIIFLVFTTISDAKHDSSSNTL